MKLQDRVAFVTGGGSGIGRAMCLLFAREGAIVVAADLIPERAVETAALVTAAGGVATGLEIDVADAAKTKLAIDTAIEQYGRIDILVNNAGLSVGDRITDFDEAMWDLNVDVVLKGVYLCSREVLPSMIERQSGVILNIGSVNGIMAIGESAYSAAKAGMVNLTQNMAIHYGEDGIRVNLIAPGTSAPRSGTSGSRPIPPPSIFSPPGIRSVASENPTTSPKPPCSSAPTTRTGSPVSSSRSTAVFRQGITG
jgi:NAD(P)-dependent dehydrogenase (short-subunit alcohol dehydrogenase family)